MKPILHRATLWAPPFLYGGLVYFLSSLSDVGPAGRIPDTLSHPVEYAGLTFLIVRALNSGLSRPVTGRAQFGAIGLAVLYAVSDEIHQIHVPRRTASLKDVLSDALGAVLVVGAVEIFQRIRDRRRTDRVAVTLYTRKECHLCRDAREILDRLSREVPLRVEEVDVDRDPSLASRFGAEVPVIFAGGDKISKLRPDEEALRRRLVRRAPPSR